MGTRNVALSTDSAKGPQPLEGGFIGSTQLLYSKPSTIGKKQGQIPQANSLAHGKHLPAVCRWDRSRAGKQPLKLVPCTLSGKFASCLPQLQPRNRGDYLYYSLFSFPPRRSSSPSRHFQGRNDRGSSLECGCFGLGSVTLELRPGPCELSPLGEVVWFGSPT